MLSCNNKSNGINSTSAVSDSIDIDIEATKEIDLEIINNCELSDSIYRATYNILNGTIDISIKKYSKLLERNISNQCKFPRNKDEQKLLLEFVSFIVTKSHETEYLQLLFLLRSYFPRNVEFLERLNKIIPKVVVNNPKLFLEELNKFPEIDQRKILGNLEFIETKEDILGLYKDLNEIESEELLKIKEKALFVLRKEFGPILE